MTMLLQPIIISVIFFLKYSSERENEKSNLIFLTKNFLHLQKNPPKITSFLTCWSEENLLKVSKQLSFYYYANNISKTKILLNYCFPEEHLLFLLDLNCNESTNIINEAFKLRLFKYPFRWLIFGEINNLSNFYFGLDSRIFVATKINKGYGIKSIYKLSSNYTNFYVDDIGFWTKNDGFLYFNELGPQNRSNVIGTTITVSYVVTNLDTLNHLSDYRYPSIDSTTKMNNILVNHLLDSINSTKKYIVQRTWGYKNATTNTYSGLVGDLEQGLADISGSGLFCTVDRIPILDPIAGTAKTYMKFIFREPQLSYVTNIFTLPFHTTVWYCSFVTVFLTGVVIYIIVLWEWRDPEFRKKITLQTLRPNIFDVVLLEISAVTQQGAGAVPKSNAGRIVTILTYLILMFMYTSYSANIVALLQSTTDSIQTVQDLRYSRIKLGVEDIVYSHYYMKNLNEPIRKAIYEEKIAPKGQKANFFTAEEGMRKMRDEFFAFHIEIASAYRIISETFQDKEKCSLKIIDFVNYIIPYIAAQKNSTYKEIIKIGMKKIDESGIQRREFLRFYTPKPSCNSRGNNFESVGLIDCYAAFLIFGIGVGIALVFLIIENLTKRYVLWKNKNEIEAY